MPGIRMAGWNWPNRVQNLLFFVPEARDEGRKPAWTQG